MIRREWIKDLETIAVSIGHISLGPKDKFWEALVSVKRFSYYRLPIKEIYQYLRVRVGGITCGQIVLLCVWVIAVDTLGAVAALDWDRTWVPAFYRYKQICRGVWDFEGVGI